MKKIIDKFEFAHVATLIIFSIISVIILKFIIPKYCFKYYNLATFLVWCGIAIAVIQFDSKIKLYKKRENKVKTLIIVIIVSYLFYFGIGLFTGYTYSPYSQKITTVLKNLVYFLGLVMMEELTRNKLLKDNDTMLGTIVITILFTIYQMNFAKIAIDIKINTNIFQYVISDIVLILASNILCTYLSKVGGIVLNYSYIIPVTLVKYVLPIFPNMDWFATTSLKLLLVIILIISINYEEQLKVRKLTKRERKKASPIKTIPIAIILIVFITFVAGILPYKPIAIMSDSMVPTFSRGAVVVTKKIGKHYDKVKIGDILEYKTNKGTVIHRIVEINKNNEGKYTFITKGDANNSNDKIVIAEDEAIGIAKLWIPYIGYPAVLVSEILFNKKSYIVIN